MNMTWIIEQAISGIWIKGLNADRKRNLIHRQLCSYRLLCHSNRRDGSESISLKGMREHDDDI